MGRTGNLPVHIGFRSHTAPIAEPTRSLPVFPAASGATALEAYVIVRVFKFTETLPRSNLSLLDSFHP
jgi:hypothetical protein